MNKFKAEIMALQGLTSRAHSTESESSTAFAAVLIGISSMKNRPLKTFLTAFTIILLTFTILSFSSFSSKIGVIKTYKGMGTGRNRIEIFRKTHIEMPSAIQKSIEALYDKDFNILKRNAHYHDPRKAYEHYSEPMDIVLNPKNNRIIKLDAVMGFQNEEIDESKEIGALFFNKKFKKASIPSIYLSKIVSSELNLAKDDNVIIRV